MLLLGVVGSDQQSVFLALFNDDDVVKFWSSNDVAWPRSPLLVHPPTDLNLLREFNVEDLNKNSHPSDAYTPLRLDLPRDFRSLSTGNDVPKNGMASLDFGMAAQAYLHAISLPEKWTRH